jgi:hypothetical protein
MSFSLPEFRIVSRSEAFILDHINFAFVQIVFILKALHTFTAIYIFFHQICLVELFFGNLMAVNMVNIFHKSLAAYKELAIDSVIQMP